METENFISRDFAPGQGGQKTLNNSQTTPDRAKWFCLIRKEAAEEEAISVKLKESVKEREERKIRVSKQHSRQSRNS